MYNTLENIYRAGLKLLVPTTPTETYEIIAKEAMKLVGADSATIHLKTGNEFKVVYSTVPEFYNVQTRKKGNTYTAFVTKKPVIARITDVAKAHPIVGKFNLKSAIYIPLSYQNKSIGVLTVNTKEENKFTENELNILVLFGSMISLAIRKSQLYDETKKALDLRDFFISMAAHELRTPLTSISGYIQLLKSKLDGKDNPEEKWVYQMWRESNRLTNLINELLEVSKIKQGKLSYVLKECNLIDIVCRSSENFQLAHPGREINLILKDKEQLIIIGDFEKLLQIFTNLLNNAVKFSPPESVIEIKVSKIKKYAFIEIIDHGQGIPEKDLAKVFEGFYKGEDNLKEGMGLGLFISKDIISRHHGTIEATSTVGEGTTIKVKIPRR